MLLKHKMRMCHAQPLHQSIEGGLRWFATSETAPNACLLHLKSVGSKLKDGPVFDITKAKAIKKDLAFPLSP